MKTKQPIITKNRDYPYTKRISELNRIVRIPYRGLKLRALKRFEEQERKILSERENPLIRSQALDRVTNAIASIEGAIHQEQHGELDFLQQIRRNLFHEDDTNAVREVPGMFFSPMETTR